MINKTKFITFPILIFGCFLVLTLGCKKEEKEEPTLLIPTLTTSSVSSITQTSANSGGNISNDGGASVTSRGVCWSTAQTPTTADTKTTDGTGTGSFTSSISGLTSNTTYYVRAYAINSVGTAYGNAVSFTTLQNGAVVVPVLTTSQVTNITINSAIGGGNISNDGGATVSARGICWSTNQYPIITDNITSEGTGTGTYTSSITGLAANTIYYVRAYATNSAGTAYGTEVNFKTQTQSSGNTVTDIDGNVYNTVTIGTQVWMAENLRVTKYRNGNPINNVTVDSEWSNLTDGAYSIYNNDANNALIYGNLYNFFAVNDSRNIAPAGWHIPTDAEWTTLTTFLGGEGVAGGKLKEAGFISWDSPNTGATNEVGFNGVGNGARFINGSFYYLKILGYYWTATEFSSSATWNRSLTSGAAWVDRAYDDKKLGYAVRCVKD